MRVRHQKTASHSHKGQRSRASAQAEGQRFCCRPEQGKPSWEQAVWLHAENVCAVAVLFLRVCVCVLEDEMCVCVRSLGLSASSGREEEEGGVTEVVAMAADELREA